MPSKIPVEVIKEMADFNDALTNFESVLAHFTQNEPQSETLTTMEKVRVDLMRLFAINSLYWTYLRLQGKDAKDDPELSAELARTKEYMGKFKQFEEAGKRPKYSKKTVKRFVQNSLIDISTPSRGNNSTLSEVEVASSTAVESEVQQSYENAGEEEEDDLPTSSKKKRH